jgi:hypothetical protein
MPGPYALGTLLIFNAQAVPGADLALDVSTMLGNPGAGVATLARDVCIGFDSSGVPGVPHAVYVVGSTSDPMFLAGVATPPPATGAALAGPSDGFVLLSLESGLLFGGAFHGGPGDDGLTGVNCWNEFGGHIGVTGFTDQNGTIDIDVGTYLQNATFGPANPAGNTAPANGTFGLLAMRRTQVGGANEDRPAVMGPISATTAGLPFATNGLGQESGGGIAVGLSGRINTVGRTTAGGLYPVVGGRPQAVGFDAVRSELDMVVAAVGLLAGTGRTDGTGFQTGGAAFPILGLEGGTTPICSLADFGVRIGEPAPELQRMFVDVEGGIATGSTDAAVVLVRPTNDATAAFTVAVLQFGLPPAPPWLNITGADFWLGDPAANFVSLAELVQPLQGFRVPLFPLTGTSTISVQFIGLLTTPVVGPAPGCSSVFTASPALFFSF